MLWKDTNVNVSLLSTESEVSALLEQERERIRNEELRRLKEERQRAEEELLRKEQEERLQRQREEEAIQKERVILYHCFFKFEHYRKHKKK